MIVKILRNYNPLNLLFIIITGIVLWTYPMFLGVDFTSNINTQMPIYKSIIKVISYNNIILPIFVSLLLILGQLLLIQRIDFKYQFSGSRNFLAGFIFILLSSLIMVVNYLHPIIYANIFLLLAIERIFDSYNNEKTLTNFFDASLLISISSLIYLNYLFFIILILISALILKPSPVKEWILIIIGFISTFLVYFSFYFILNGEINSLLNIIVENFAIFAKFILPHNILIITSLSIIFLLLIISLVFFFRNSTLLNANVIIFFRILNLLIIFIILIYLIMPTTNYEIVLSLSIPLSFLVANFFTNSKRKKIIEILFFIFIVSIIFVHLNNFLLKIN